jgi:PHP domain-containing protein
MRRGAIHIHSSYSDGEFSLRELREIFVLSGCDFVCMTDHAEAFDRPKLESYIQECQSLSDEKFSFVPGLEYECQDRMHILGYGVTWLVDSQDPQQVIQKIEEEGGISVIAHPKITAFPWIETFRVLPTGIECWNSKYDGQYAPRPETFSLLESLQARKPSLLAFYGQDLHWKKQYRGLLTTFSKSICTREALLEALSAGEYVGSKNNLVLPSNGKLPKPILDRFSHARKRSGQVRCVMKSAKKLADKLGFQMPARLKAQFRRVF